MPAPVSESLPHLLSKSYRNCICGCNLNCNCRTRPASTHTILGNPPPYTSPSPRAPSLPSPSSRHLPFALLCAKVFPTQLAFFIGLAFRFIPRADPRTKPNRTELDLTELSSVQYGTELKSTSGGVKRCAEQSKRKLRRGVKRVEEEPRDRAEWTARGRCWSRSRSRDYASALD